MRFNIVSLKYRGGDLVEKYGIDAELEHSNEETNDLRYSIEINSIDDLMKLVYRAGQIIIDDCFLYDETGLIKGEKNIIIYDDWNE